MPALVNLGLTLLPNGAIRLPIHGFTPGRAVASATFSCFSLHIPSFSRIDQHCHPNVAWVGGVGQGSVSKTVLLADDNHGIRVALSSFFADLGWTVAEESENG